MNILYVDIDSLRPDHLGCYGYHRATSPNIDRIARDGVRFTNCYASDAPCLPSRTALFSGRFGIHTGVVNHGGVAAQPFIEGPGRAFRDRFGRESWPARLREAGYHTVTLSSFGERHGAWHWYAGFNEVINCGKGGNENADEVSPLAMDWIRRKSRSGNPWFMHLNFWDPHTPYRVPEEFGNPFSQDPIPAWYDEALRREHWQGCGPHSAREVMGYSDEVPDYLVGRHLPRQPWSIDSMDEARRVFDGYDTGVRYADEHLGRVLNTLADAGQLENTAILISADHGENLGELNIYGDHQTADHITCRVPLILRWPGITDGQGGRVDEALHYQFDFAETCIDLVGGSPAAVDAQSLAGALREGRPSGRSHLVLSQGAWCVQRGVRWGDHLYMRTWHDAWHNFPTEMLFDIAADPHELNNCFESERELGDKSRELLEGWTREQLSSSNNPDPFETVLAEGGSLHSREKGAYFERLRSTERSHLADIMEKPVLRT